MTKLSSVPLRGGIVASSVTVTLLPAHVGRDSGRDSGAVRQCREQSFLLDSTLDPNLGCFADNKMTTRTLDTDRGKQLTDELTH